MANQACAATGELVIAQDRKRAFRANALLVLWLRLCEIVSYNLNDDCDNYQRGKD